MPLPKIAIIRISDAQKMPLPLYGNPVGTSMTLLSANSEAIKIAPNHSAVIETGLAIALPVGLEAQVRSLKQSTKTGVFVLNAPATIDAADREEIKVCLYNASNESVIIKEKDPIALLVFSPAIRVEWDDMTFKNPPHFTQTKTILTQPIENIVENQEQTENITEDQTDIEEFEPVLQNETNNEILPTDEQEQKDVIEPSKLTENITQTTQPITTEQQITQSEDIEQQPKVDNVAQTVQSENITQPTQPITTEQQPIQSEDIEQKIQFDNVAQTVSSDSDTPLEQNNIQLTENIVQKTEENEMPVVKPPAFITEREENQNKSQSFSGEKNEN